MSGIVSRALVQEPESLSADLKMSDNMVRPPTLNSFYGQAHLFPVSFTDLIGHLHSDDNLQKQVGTSLVSAVLCPSTICSTKAVG